jgi:2,3-bisphosphoglycerate-independent phosphoglycerate mutase
VLQGFGRGVLVEFILATAIQDANGQVRPRIRDNDAVIFFNYRSDRGRQLSQVFLDPEFDAHVTDETEPADEDVRLRQKFRRHVWPQVHYATMTRYSADLPCPIAFEPRPQREGLGETASKAGKTQLRMAETEKYPHVTYFFSGGIETPWEGEERILVPSPKVATYDLQPEMSAPEVIEKIVAAIRSERFDLIILNFANPDMVGHTGVLEAAIKAVETIDAGLGQVLQAIEDTGGALLVIADHGNCEQMIDYETRQPHTAHTTNPVPCILVGKGLEKETLRSGGRLADVAPTLLGLMGVPQPPEMTGIDLRGGGAQQLVEVDATAADPALAALKSASEKLAGALRFYQMAGSSTPGLQALGTSVQQQQELLATQLTDGGSISSGHVSDGGAAPVLLPAEIRAAALQIERENARQFEAAASSAPEPARDLLTQLAAGAQERERQLS